MTMRDIPQNKNVGDIKGTWRKVMRDGQPIAMLSCPQCGFTAAIGDDGGTHYISSAGIVNPSVVCDGYIGNKKGPDKVPCDWHEFIHLNGWKA